MHEMDGVGRDGTEQSWIKTDGATMNRLLHEYATTQEEEEVMINFRYNVIM